MVAHFLFWVMAAGLTGHGAVQIAAAGAAVVHYSGRTRAARKAFSLRGLLRHCLPSSIMTSRWTYIDLLYYGASKVLGIFIYPFVAGLAVACAGATRAGLQVWFGHGPGLALNGPTLSVFLVAGLLARDFTAFYIHMMQHRIPVLWEFHKVHHAPESLIPLTGRRLHPLELLANLTGDAPVLGIIVGMASWLTHQGLDFMIVATMGLQTVMDIVTLSPLRHSHIDLRLGWFERFVLSPAHHRLHHSVEPQHWDKNFAATFPFWDRLWRTFLPPPPIDTYRLGLPDGESSRYTDLLSCYVLPVRASVRRLRQDGWRAIWPCALARHPVQADPPRGGDARALQAGVTG